MSGEKRCEHESFRVHADVNRMADTFPMVFMVDIRLECECGEKFRFLGLPVGISFHRPMVSISGTELRVPIEPEGEPRLLDGPYVFEMLPKEPETKP